MHLIPPNLKNVFFCHNKNLARLRRCEEFHREIFKQILYACGFLEQSLLPLTILLMEFLHTKI